VVYRHDPASSRSVTSADRVSFYQLKTMLQGVLQRGTAHAIASLAPYVAGKTGTTEGENDAWFMGFTNDVTVAVWVGYDNADGKRRTLGGGQTGGRVAVPIFEQIVEATFANYARKTPLSPPSPEAKKELVAMQIDLNSGNRLSERGTQGFTEYFRLRNGRVEETQYNLVSPDEVATSGDLGDGEAYVRDPNAGYGRGYYTERPSGGYYAERPSGGGLFQGGLFGGLFGQPQPQPQQRQAYPPNGGAYGDLRPRSYEDRRWVPPRRVDPDVPWRERQRDY
jgi:penicillin-binding protein 1A